jgi:hypothetical protein
MFTAPLLSTPPCSFFNSVSIFRRLVTKTCDIRVDELGMDPSTKHILADVVYSTLSNSLKEYSSLIFSVGDEIKQEVPRNAIQHDCHHNGIVYFLYASYQKRNIV